MTTHWTVTEDVTLPQQITDLQVAIGVKATGVVDDDTWAALKGIPDRLNDALGQSQALSAGLDDLQGRVTTAIATLNGG